VHSMHSMRLLPQQLAGVISGPVVTDALGVPCYAATIWIDFLHADLALNTRAAYQPLRRYTLKLNGACRPSISTGCC
jgi:hypothetical protein